MNAPLISIIAVVLVFIILLVIKSKLRDDIRLYGFVICIMAAIGSIKWYVDVKTEKERIYQENQSCIERMVSITLAIEAFNKDRINQMENLDVQKLIEKKLLPANMNNLMKKYGCEYTNDGDLTTSGIIVCKKHGAPRAIAERLSKEK